MDDNELIQRRALRREFDERLRQVQPDMSMEEIKAILGEPAQTSADVPASIARWNRDSPSMFNPQTDDIDTFLTYADTGRPNTVHYFGFNRGKLCFRMKYTNKTLI